MKIRRTGLLIGSLGVGLAAAVVLVSIVAAGTQIDILGPEGSEAFGSEVHVLPTGNILVLDPGYDAGAVPDVGAVYLYDGDTGALISRLTGSVPGDGTGMYIDVLDNGNFLVGSPNWDNDSVVDAGAVTWVDGSSGISGMISPVNSLVGNSVNDRVGDRWGGVYHLDNGNYLVISAFWDNGTVVDAGAVTWGDGETGVTGMVSEANSLVGSTSGDQIGEFRELSNGNFLVVSPFWDNGSAKDAGAVTWGDGMRGISGVVSAANSLVGSTSGDQIGEFRELSNGNFLVVSPYWDNGSVEDAGAVTWSDGMNGVIGTISANNSLVGSSGGDLVGDWPGIVELSNGNYLVASPSWSNGTIQDVGAVTLVDGMMGVTGEVSAAISLVGSTSGDKIGEAVTALPNGNFVIASYGWDNGVAVDAGAITWGDGSQGLTGTVSEHNSLVGTMNGDILDNQIYVLPNGNYVLANPYWDNGEIVDAGAVTWGDGMKGVNGTINAANSLVGTLNDDKVGVWPGVRMLANGNYVVVSVAWDNSEEVDAGAVTWGDGMKGVTGTVSTTNSLVGSTSYSQIGVGFVHPLSNGNYLVSSPFWGDNTVDEAGALTWCDGTKGVTGTVSAANSLVGSMNADMVGRDVITLTNGNYLVISSYWDNGIVEDAGAVTWGDGRMGITGTVNRFNSLVGSTEGDLENIFVTELDNGNYIVQSGFWDNVEAVNAGAITWGDGTKGVTGTISAANSLVGSTSDDQIGYPGYLTSQFYELANGNYLVATRGWDSGTALDAGAVTWGDGTKGVTGTVSADNSLVGIRNNDNVGNYVTLLANGNYVVCSVNWNNGAGAATWGDGEGGLRGTVSAANSLIGSTGLDRVGWTIPLANGNYVVESPDWDNVTAVDAGALTWGDGTKGVTGTVSAVNSLVGTTSNDQVGGDWVGGIRILTNGNYVVVSPLWDNGSIVNAGAVTWGDGMNGLSGAINAANSLVGSTNDNQIGAYSPRPMGFTDQVRVLENGNNVVKSYLWDNGTIADAGAVTWGDGRNGTTIGVIDGDNSVLGSAVGGGLSLNLLFDYGNQQLIVRRPAENIITLFRPDPMIAWPYHMHLPYVTTSGDITPE